LNDYPDISLATKKIVKSYVKKVGYKANNQATYLRTQKTKTIGVILPDVTNYFFLEILEGIMSQANKNDYTVILGTSKESEVEEKKLIYQFLQQKVDGILMSLAQDTSRFDHLKDVIE
jgi:LacI family transcriptional regulator